LVYKTLKRIIDFLTTSKRYVNVYRQFKQSI